MTSSRPAKIATLAAILLFAAVSVPASGAIVAGATAGRPQAEQAGFPADARPIAAGLARYDSDCEWRKRRQWGNGGYYWKRIRFCG